MNIKNRNIKMAFIKLLGDRIEFEIQKPDDEIDFEIIELCEQLLSDLIPETNVSNKEMLK